MGMPDSTLVNLIEKVRSWLSWGNSDTNSISSGVKMTDKNCHCEENTLNSCIKYHCQSCGRLLCGKCVHGVASFDVAAPSCSKETMEAVVNIKTCKLCFELGPISDRKSSSKVHPSESPRHSPEPPSPSFSGERFEGHSPSALTQTTEESFSDYLSPVSFCRSSSRSDEDDGEDSTNNFFDVSSEYFQDTSDIESVYLSARNEFNSFMSLGSSPSDSPPRIHITSDKVGHSVQREQASSQNDGSFDQEQVVLEKPAKGTWDPEKVIDLPIFQKKLLNFETNDLIWIPPPPYDVADEEENMFVTFEDEDDEVGDSGEMFSPNDSVLFSKQKPHKEPFRAVVQGHFRHLVFQLLQGQGIISEDWLNIITEVAWKAANFIKPDTGGGGSMDPCDYVKVKCVASGRPSETELIKGVVCTKNIKHKRMISQYRNARLLLLGGSLEYQRVPNQLASFDTLLQQEKDHLKMIISKIEAHRPNVLLVEKSVSSFAQDQLLAKEISLVLNVKQPLLERIARCSGATITPSTDHIPRARLGHCEHFHLEKITEDHEPVNQLNRRPSKTLMFFEGCPRRLGCTVLLRGSTVEELNKVKNVVQFAVFAAYHLSLETSFLADEGATLPKIGGNSYSPEKITSVPNSVEATSFSEQFDVHLERGLQESLSELGEIGYDDVSVPDEFVYRRALSDACDENLALNETHNPMESGEKADDATEYYSANDNSQSILVSLSSHCIPNGTACERSRLIRVKFYGPSDKPLGRYIREDLFNESFHCRSCNKPTEAHSICYTHQHGNLMINVRRLPLVKLHGERDGKIWMWHRCLRCPHINGAPPATPRVVMSDAAWGLSFGKFLELSFSNHATGNRVATCGHSLQRDCLRFYGFGSMIACFQYSPINILSVRLPPAILEFCGPGEQSWINIEASELLRKAEAVYAEISAVLQEINHRSLFFMHEFCDANDLHRRVLELNDMLANEQSYFQDLLCIPNNEILEQNQAEVDILEINRLRRSLLISSRVWDRRLYLLDSLLRTSSTPKALNDVEASIGLKDSQTYPKDFGNEECPVLQSNNQEPKSEPSVKDDYILPTCPLKEWDDVLQYEGNAFNSTSLERVPSAASILSDKIDSAWCGEITETLSTSQINQKENPSFRRLLLSRTRVHSFDSAQMIQERMSPSLHLSKLRSFQGDYKYTLRNPVSNVQRTRSQVEAEKLSVSPSLIPFPSLLPEGARLMVPQKEIVLTVYDDEPTSIVSYALTSKEYADWISDKHNGPERGSNASLTSRANSIASDLSTWSSSGSMDLDYMHFTNYTPEDASSSTVSSPHLRMSFEDDSSNSGKTKFHVTCYFGKQFDLLRRKCCPNELDFVRSLSRCRRWSAQGGKSNVYFAKSFDERFIIKQVTKTELESFQEFSSQYFKYLTDALTSQSPTCLVKILGIYQVVVKPSKGGKETKMDFMVMENLFFRKNISKVYDLKGSARSRYNPDTTGANTVLLDTNLLETLCTNPLFLGSKAKRKLERAVWNDTSFLAGMDVMDYSLLVGVDETGKELVLGIIDYMRQYTWDKHLETWVKASGILGGPKNASPTIISPKQYKKRFRKAMSTYFLALPDQWSTSY